MLGVGHILNRLFVLITPVLLLIYTTAVCSGFDMITILTCNTRNLNLVSIVNFLKNVRTTILPNRIATRNFG